MGQTLEFVASNWTIGTNIRICTVESNCTVRTNCSIRTNIRICSIGSNFTFGTKKNYSTGTKNVSVDLRKHMKSSHKDLLLDS